MRDKVESTAKVKINSKEAEDEKLSHDYHS
jgi:hypothetical protein